MSKTKDFLITCQELWEATGKKEPFETFYQTQLKLKTNEQK